MGSSSRGGLGKSPSWGVLPAVSYEEGAGLMFLPLQGAEISRISPSIRRKGSRFELGLRLTAVRARDSSSAVVSPPQGPEIRARRSSYRRKDPRFELDRPPTAVGERNLAGIGSLRR